MTEKEQYINRLIINSYKVKDIGLLYGRFGHILTLYELSKESVNRNQVCFFADCELERLICSINKHIPIDFSNGLCGIGWGLEFLIKKGVVEGRSTEICEEIDEQLMLTNLNNFDYSLEHGIEGVLHYVLAHLSNCFEQGDGVPFSYNFILSLRELCKKILYTNKGHDLINLAKSFINYTENDTIPTYAYNILNFVDIDNNCKILPQNISLKNGICGFLIKIHNESNDITSCI